MTTQVHQSAMIHSPVGLRGLIRKRQNVRALLYLGLLLCDIIAVRYSFSVGVGLKGEHWLSPNGVELGWLILPIHIILGIRQGAYAQASLQSRVEAVRRSSRAFIYATALICLLMFFQAAGPLVSRLAFGISILLSITLIAVLRILFLTLFIPKDRSRIFGELLIVDGAPVPRAFKGEVVDALATGLLPDKQDPAQLARIAEVIRSFDRVIVSCASKGKRSDWAQMLKCFDIYGEVVMDERSPLGAVAVSRFLGQDTVVVARGTLSVGDRIRKRTMDIVISTAALMVCIIPFIIVAIAIKLESRGPIFFAQPRVGRGNRLFNILKFRSMRVETSDLAGNRSTSRDDDRITRVGRFIRRTSVDELPQLINVLLGHMSIVGPRPHALGSLAGDKLFWQVDDTYWHRHTLKPGITGLAQVRGFRGATHLQADLENRLQADLEYISGWSLWRDIKILMSTIRVVVHPQAY